METFDLIIVGAGSGNMIPGDEFGDWNVAIVEKDVFGGTCLNRGCIPSKMFVYAADVARSAQTAGKYGLSVTYEGADWPAIVNRVFGRIDPIGPSGEAYREGLDHTTVVKGTARFVEDKVLDVDGRRITAPRIVLGAGSRPWVPDVPGLADVGYRTSDDIMRLEKLPERLVILGGGVIAAEMGHVFSALGSEVTIVIRGSHLLSGEDHDIAEAFTAAMRRRIAVVTGGRDFSARHNEAGIELGVTDDEGTHRVEGDELLVATGRTPNSDLLGVEHTGIETDLFGRVRIDSRCRTSVEGIWAFGDLTAEYALKHLANAEARVIQHNLLHPGQEREVDYSHHPRAVFGDPQVAAVGLTEQQCRSEHLDYVTARREFAATAYGWAMEDTTSFAKVLAERSSGRILGAHVMGPHASTLIQPLVQAMQFAQTARDLAERVIYIHPALSEVVENVLLDLPVEEPAR